jgi:lipid-A-disaccharide synthase
VSELLVVAGEASGDRAAAAVVARLGARTFGMGLGIARAFGAITKAARKRKPRAALLVNYTEFNARLAPRLHARGVRVVWYGAPQVWAWRPGRARSLRRSVDAMAVMLPFEEPIWRQAGIDAEYVGHPARETTPLERSTARRALGMTERAAAVALLPGSRPHEVRRLLEPMLDAYERVRADRASVDGVVLLAASLDPKTRAWAMKRAEHLRVPVFEVDAYTGALGVLPAFDVALCASGTAALEAALVRAVPVVAYKVGLATELAARALLKSPHVALPNVILGRRAFAELLQRDVRTSKLADALEDALDRRAELVLECDEVDRRLGDERAPSVRVAHMLAPWM